MSVSGDIEILNPQWFWLLPGTLLFYFWMRYSLSKDNNNDLLTGAMQAGYKIFYPLLKLLPADKRVSQDKRGLSTLVFCITLALFITALTQPVRIGEKIPDAPKQHDIMFIVDTSVSMLLSDYTLEGEPIDRMSMLKVVLAEFVKNLKGNRISIVVFGDSPYTLLPFSSDQQLVLAMLSRIETGMAGRHDVVGNAIAFGVKQVTENKNRKQVLVLFTDMNRSIGDISPATATEMAKQAQLPLYTIAIGAAGKNAEESKTVGLIYEPVNLTLLETMARQTGARSYHARDAESLKNAVFDIGQREKNIELTAPRYYQSPLYHWFLLSALSIIFLYQFIAVFLRKKA